MATEGLHPAAVAHTAPQARAGRSLVERLAVRFPALARLVARIVFGWRRLPGRNALIEYAYRRAYVAFNRRDWELNTLLHDPSRYILRAGGMRRLNADAKEEYRGIDGYIEGQLQFASGWRELKVRFDGVQAGPDVFVGLIAVVGGAELSGIQLDQPVADVHRIRDGLLVEQTFYWDRVAGLRSVGIRDFALTHSAAGADPPAPLRPARAPRR